MNRQPGYIDGRRTRVGGVPLWGPVPDVLIPGAMEAYGIFEDFIGVEDIAANNSLCLPSGAWEYLIAGACTLIQHDLAGGAVLITTAAADNNGGQIIMGSVGAGGGIFFPAAGKHLWFEARIQAGVVRAAEFNYYVGLINPVAADILANNGGALIQPDMLGFVVRDTEVNWSFVGDNAAAQDLNPLGAGCVANNAWHTIGFYVNGVTDVSVYYDRVLVAAGAVLTANIPVLGLMPAIAVKAGAAAGLETIAVDYIMCVQLR